MDSVGRRPLPRHVDPPLQTHGRVVAGQQQIQLRLRVVQGVSACPHAGDWGCACDICGSMSRDRGVRVSHGGRFSGMRGAVTTEGP